MSGKEHGHPKKKSIISVSSSLENGVRTLQDQTYSSSDLQERRISDDPSSSLPPDNDFVKRLPTPTSREASEQSSRSLSLEGHGPSQNGTPQDALPQARHELRTAAPESSQGSVALVPLSIDTRNVTAEPNRVSNHE